MHPSGGRVAGHSFGAYHEKGNFCRHMTSSMNIAFFGSSLVSAYWNGAATYYRGLIRALNERGHRCTFYEPDAYDRQQHRDMTDPDWARVVVYPAVEEAALEALGRAAGSDL